MESSGAAAKILSTESLGGQPGNVVLPDANKVRSGINFDVLGGVTGTYEGPPLPPSNLLSTDVSSTQINISWNSEANATSYLLIVNEDFPVSFVPTDGDTYGISSQTGGSIIYVGSATSHNQTTGVSADNTYHYALYSYDGENYSVVASQSTANTFCSDLPGEWVRVPGDPNYGTKDFCVMKYEASGSGTPASVAGAIPLGGAGQAGATTACAQIPGAQLISNDQWMTLATNIALQPINWSTGSVGEGELNRGHGFALPGITLAASSDDNDPCFGITGANCIGWNSRKRTHSLSNGEVIWDLSGNLYEWTTYNDANGKASPGVDWIELKDVIDGSSQLKSEFVPQVIIDEDWDHLVNGVGQYNAGPNGSGGALMRGGYWGAAPGIFTAYMGTGLQWESCWFPMRSSLSLR